MAGDMPWRTFEPAPSATDSSGSAVSPRHISSCLEDDEAVSKHRADPALASLRQQMARALHDLQVCVVFLGGAAELDSRQKWWLAAAWLGLPIARVPELAAFYLAYLLPREDVQRVRVPNCAEGTAGALLEMLDAQRLKAARARPPADFLLCSSMPSGRQQHGRSARSR